MFKVLTPVLLLCFCTSVFASGDLCSPPSDAARIGRNIGIAGCDVPAYSPNGFAQATCKGQCGACPAPYTGSNCWSSCMLGAKENCTELSRKQSVSDRQEKQSIESGEFQATPSNGRGLSPK